MLVNDGGPAIGNPFRTEQKIPHGPNSTWAISAWGNQDASYAFATRRKTPDLHLFCHQCFESTKVAVVIQKVRFYIRSISSSHRDRHRSGCVMPQG